MDHKFHVSDREVLSSGRVLCIMWSTLTFFLHALGDQWRVLRRMRSQICNSSKSTINELEESKSEMRFIVLNLLRTGLSC